MWFIAIILFRVMAVIFSCRYTQRTVQFARKYIQNCNFLSVIRNYSKQLSYIFCIFFFFHYLNRANDMYSSKPWHSPVFLVIFVLQTLRVYWIYTYLICVIFVCCTNTHLTDQQNCSAVVSFKLYPDVFKLNFLTFSDANELFQKDNC